MLYIVFITGKYDERHTTTIIDIKMQVKLHTQMSVSFIDTLLPPE